jgi:iron complex outermembrane receptor protein
VVLDRPELCSDPSARDPQLAPFGGGVNHFAGTWYFDLEGTWDTPWNGRISLGVRNVFDRDPPVSFTTSANNFDPGYEVPGRFWFLGYRQRF